MLRSLSASRLRLFRAQRLTGRTFITSPTPASAAVPASDIDYECLRAEDDLNESLIPHVDVTPYMVPSSSRQSREDSANDLDRACREVGFFTISVSEKSQRLLQQLYSRADDFFNLPLSVKEDFLVPDSSVGYTPVGGELNVGSDGPVTSDIHEALDVSMVVTEDGFTLSKSLNWADPRLSGLYNDIVEYNWSCMNTGRALVKAMLDGLDVDPAKKPSLLRSFELPQSGLRLLRYPATSNVDLDATTATGAPLGIANGEHTDYECLTLLNSTSPGLEVKLLDDKWYGVASMPDRYTCNIGDAMSFWSGGTYVSTPHRVRRVSQERMSIPFFLGPAATTPLLPLVGSGAGGNTMTYGEYLDAKFAKAFPQL